MCLINNILLHSRCTVRKTSLVAGFPSSLSAVHLKYPSSCLLMTRGKVTTLVLSETLVQVMRGFGFPTAASQFRVTLSPSVAVWLPDMFVIAGGTERKATQSSHKWKEFTDIRDIQKWRRSALLMMLAWAAESQVLSHVSRLKSGHSA